MESGPRVCRCCQECDSKTTGEFQKIIELKASGLSIYLHNDSNDRPAKKRSSIKQDEVFVLYNPKEKIIKRYDYISELCQYKTKCFQCKALIQRIRSTMDEISDINASEIRSICQHCKRVNPTGQCKRCEFIANRFFSNRVKLFEERQIRIEVWLCKVRALLQTILENNIFCRHRVHQKTDDVFDRLLRDLDTQLPTLGKIGGIVDARLDRYSSMKETKDMLETFIGQLRSQNTDRLYSSDESLYMSSSRASTSCACKYLMDKKFNERRVDVFSKEETIKIPKPVEETDDMRNSANGSGFKGWSDFKGHATHDAVGFKDGTHIKGDSGTKRSRNRELYSTKETFDTMKSRTKKGVVSGANGPLSAKEIAEKNKFVTKEKPRIQSVAGTKGQPGTEKSAKGLVGSKDVSSRKKKSNKENNCLGLDENKQKSLSYGDNKNKANQKQKARISADEAFKTLILMEKNKLKAHETPLKKSEQLKEHQVKIPKIDELPILKITEKLIDIEVSSDSIKGTGIKHSAVRPKEMIKGIEIVPFDPLYREENKEPHEPLFFKRDATCYLPTIAGDAGDSVSTDVVKQNIERKSQPKSKTSFSTPKGVMRYELSNREFIDKGWTKLPTTKVMKRMNIYKMVPVNPKNDWFTRHSGKEIMHYDTGEKLAIVESNNRGSWYYKNGLLALDYYPAQELNAGQRIVIYSNCCREKGNVEKPLPVTVLASFDYLGNGVVYDQYGNIRLKYNQSEGILIDSKIGTPGLWKWHMLNDPPVLQPVFIDTHTKNRDPRLEKLVMSHKDKQNDGSYASRKHEEKNQDMLAIELENFVKEKANKMLKSFKPFQIRMKALKINDQFSLRILDQANIYLLFNDGPISMKLDLGLQLISSEIIDTDTAEVSQVATPYDKQPPRSKSLADIQDMLNRARKLRKVKRNTSKQTISTIKKNTT